MMLTLAILAFALLKASISLYVPIGNTYTMPGHSSIVLADSIMAGILQDTIPASECMPNVLFKCKSTKGGVTSDWRVVQKYIPTLSLILDQTSGKQLAQRPLVKQFEKYLKSLDPPKQWAATDLDAICDNPRRSSP